MAIQLFVKVITYFKSMIYYVESIVLLQCSGLSQLTKSAAANELDPSFDTIGSGAYPRSFHCDSNLAA